MLPRRALLLILAQLAAGGAVGAELPTWVSGEVPPFLSRGPNGAQGYAFELCERVSKEAGVAVDLHFFPWARAMRMVLGGAAWAGLVVARSPDREARFHWLFPVGSFRFAIYSRPEDGPLSSDVMALRGRRVAVLRASAGHEMLTAAGVAVAAEGKDYPELLALLRRGVVDAVVGPENVMQLPLAQLHLAPDSLRTTLSNLSLDLYAAAGPAMPQEARQRVVVAYQRLVDMGVIAQMKKRHPEAFFDD